MTRTKVAAIVLLLIGGLVVWQVAASAQRVVGPLPAGMSDLGSAKTVEIRDAAGQVVLRGNFVTSEEKDDEVERTATLVAAVADAKGKAEVELERAGTVVSSQEIEVEVRRLTASAPFKLMVDGREIAAFTTNRSGNADLKFTSKISATK